MDVFTLREDQVSFPARGSEARDLRDKYCVPGTPLREDQVSFPARGSEARDFRDKYCVPGTPAGDKYCVPGTPEISTVSPELPSYLRFREWS